MWQTCVPAAWEEEGPDKMQQQSDRAVVGRPSSPLHTPFPPPHYAQARTRWWCTA